MNITLFKTPKGVFARFIFQTQTNLTRKMESNCVSRVIIMVIHHLIPVSTEEEIKYSIAKTSAELRGNAAIARAIFDRKLLMQTVPFYPILMCLIDYKGFRMVAHAEINKNVFKVSLQVISIHNLNPKRLKIDETICHETSSISHYLNLKSHTVQVSDDRRVRVFLSATAEVRIL
jgi:hypothetical protein